MLQARVDVESSVGLALKRAAAALRAAMDDALRPLDLSVPQYACLEQLAHRPGMSAADLARATFVTRQSAHTTLQGLEQRGLLTRPEQAPSGRALPTRLTPAGEELLARASRDVAGVEAAMLASLGRAGAQRLRDDLVTCTRALEAGNPLDAPPPAPPG
ncbi:MarR family winged helix-turn-helix transcriptional regulator [Quadrisphaera setariae]|uniref:MarR family transcriptional regulator n=1 Tax=Quadrisphaera setariae TaxID=2593304 RepID=A0A5C8ZJZ1_9ACTN|nr:MarR family transcriptional regulator [Quadrisphaera setariae]TXR57443.1 MarR family transcriptional regulator [Quadrisphaera setariae]